MARTAAATRAMAATRLPVGKYHSAVFSGGLMTDWSQGPSVARNLNLEGDGAAAPGGIGVWQGPTNYLPNSGFRTNTTGWASNAFSMTRTAMPLEFGGWGARIVNNAASFGATKIAAAVTGASTIVTLSGYITRAEAVADIELIIRNPADTVYYGRVDLAKTTARQRVTVTYTSATAESPLFGIQKKADATAATYDISGFQVEYNAIATPLIATDGAPASRVQGTLQLSTADSGMNATQGWIAFRWTPGWSSNVAPTGQNYHWFFDESMVATPSDDSNHLTYYHPTQTWHMDRKIGGLNDKALDVAGTFTKGTPQILIYAWTATQLKFSINGAAFAVAANNYLPNLDATLFDMGYLSSSLAANFWVDSAFNWIVTGTEALSDADAATIAANGATCPTMATTPGAPTLVMPCADLMYYAAA